MKNKELSNECVTHVKKGALEYIQFKNLLKYGDQIVHCFTTRRGGVSSGECTALNLGFNRNDQRECVEENYRILCNALGIQYESLVLSRQVHDHKVKEITLEDVGKGIVRENDLLGYDALVTDIPGITLVTFYADCVPIFFADPSKKVIALAHSGWRGTVKEIAAEVIKKMESVYGCKAGEIETAIGPSIGLCCFEVGEEVYREFKDRFDWIDLCAERKESGKWHINLQEVIRRTLTNHGILPEKICMSGICTMCNPEVFFSHRGEKGKTGSLAAFMHIKE